MMPKWEYARLIHVQGMNGAWHVAGQVPETVPAGDIEKRMAAAGRQGWELVAVINEPATFVSHYFKRPLAEGEE